MFLLSLAIALRAMRNVSWCCATFACAAIRASSILSIQHTVLFNASSVDASICVKGLLRLSRNGFFIFFSLFCFSRANQNTMMSATTEQQITGTKPPPMFSLSKFLSLVTTLYFAAILVIVNRRIPFASGTEFFVLFAMMMQTAAHAKIIDFLPQSSVIHKSTKSAIIYASIVVPVFAYMLVIELWSAYYLFSYDAETDPGLISLRENRYTILNTARAFSVLNVCLFMVVVVMPMIASIMRKRITNHHRGKNN